jgi:hypothetical protein
MLPGKIRSYFARLHQLTDLGELTWTYTDYPRSVETTHSHLQTRIRHRHNVRQRVGEYRVVMIETITRKEYRFFTRYPAEDFATVSALFDSAQASRRVRRNQPEMSGGLA